ncbi:MAG: hypothetical protein R3B91_20580 [Planctomycetaceae bacterium]
MALKVSQERIDELEQMYPGIREIGQNDLENRGPAGLLALRLI